MSDYLNNLIARSLNVTEVLQPRRASLFGSPPAAGASTPGYSSGLGTTDGETPASEEGAQRLNETAFDMMPPDRSLSNRPMEPMESVGSASLASDLPIRPTMRHSPRDVLATPATALPSEQLAGQQPPLQEEPPPAHTQSVPARPARASKQPTPSPAQPVSFPGSTLPQSSQGQSAPEPHWGRDNRSSTLSASPASVGQPHLVPDLASHIEAAVPVAFQQVVPPKVAMPEAALAETASPEAAPTIRVTIGRVEVRAVMPVAPRVQRSTPPAPKLSLDEYLKRGHGGQR